MENGNIVISHLNDFVFCPASIYFHGLYGNTDTRLFQRTDQVNGTASHEAVDEGRYSSRKTIFTGLDVYSEEYGLTGKIDIYDSEKQELIERKKKIKTIYDGYVFQIYAQYYCLEEMGHHVLKMFLYSMDDNKKYPIPLPEEDTQMKTKFDETLKQMRSFDMNSFVQTNVEKCRGCIYEPSCDRSLL